MITDNMGAATRKANSSEKRGNGLGSLSVYCMISSSVGTAAGLRTDAGGRVLDGSGTPVPGLYACGNDMNSVMAGFYPGPGITLGPALTFGYLAGRDAAAL